jgi:hypothetical protein
LAGRNALYEQRSRPRVNGFLYAYPSSAQFLAPQLIAAGDSLTMYE